MALRQRKFLVQAAEALYYLCVIQDAIKLRNRLLEESTETFFCNFNDQEHSHG